MGRFVFYVAMLGSWALLHAAEKECRAPPKHYRTTLRHIESGGIGYNQGYTTLEAFFATDPKRWDLTPFLDVRGHIFNNGKLAANAGAGLRALLGKRIYGVNSYYDYRNTGRFHSNQVGVGLETLGELLDFRLNGYFPVGRVVSHPYATHFKEFSGHHMILSQKLRSAMKGGDGEVGFHFGKSKSLDFYAAAGPYYFIGKKVPATWGGKVRVGGRFKDFLTLEVSNSYDRTFHNKFQGQLSFNFPFGPKSKIKEGSFSCALSERFVQPVGRQEIIVIDKVRKESVAIDPSTGEPYFFVFVDNTSHSSGTYESPYHTLAQAQAGSSPYDILYVFPGDGTTTGMDSGIALKDYQKFWGSGLSYQVPTTAGWVTLPAQSATAPQITNTNFETEGNAIVLATHNAIRGVTISSANNDAILGADPQSLEIDSCSIDHITTYAVDATFSTDASVSLTNNQFTDNTNGVILRLNGASTVTCSDNTFTGQTSISSLPLEIAATGNTLTTSIENNIFNGNTTGSIRVDLTDVTRSDISVLNNTITHNDTGAASFLGSSVVILSEGTNESCSIVLSGNTFSENTSNALYLHTDGSFTTLEATVSGNTMTDNGGSGLVFATPVDTFTLVATNNTITGSNDNGIAVIAAGTSLSGVITLNNNTITHIGNMSNGIAVSQDFTALDLTIQDNTITDCEGTGILSYAHDGIESLTLDVSGNTVTGCQNLSSNNASALDFEQFLDLAGSVKNNILSDNVEPAVVIGSTLTAPTACLTLSGNENGGSYDLNNPDGGTFKLAPCNVESVNTGTINLMGEIELVQSCSNPVPCLLGQP